MAIILSALPGPLVAQWLNYPTPGIPRTADGKPNLTAPAPRSADGKPDLSGLWQRVSLKYDRNIAADLKPEEIPPWARALVEQRKEDLQKDSPGVQCLPWGPSYSNSSRKAKIVQNPGLILMLDEDLTYRQVFTERDDSLMNLQRLDEFGNVLLRFLSRNVPPLPNHFD